MLNKILNHTFYFNLIQLIFSNTYRIFNHKFMQWTIFSCVFENSLLLWTHSHQIMELHQIPSMSHCKYFYFSTCFHLWSYDLLLDHHLQKGKTTLIYILPTLCFIRFESSDVKFCFISSYFPSTQRLSF